MAPEQARGHAEDPRVDIWAFGVVLYEMVTGCSPFAGETYADTVGAVLHREPDPGLLPARLRPLVQRCLQKDATRRLAHIGEARDWLQRGRGADERGTAVRWRRRALTAATLVGALATGVNFRPAAIGPVLSPSRDAPFHRFQVPPPPRTSVGSYLALAPDGRQLAFLAGERGRPTIWVHSLDWGESRQITGVDDYTGSSLFWSPDGQYLAFVGAAGAKTTLKKVRVDGGPAQAIAAVPNGWGGGAWAEDNTIVFGTARGGMWRVPANGGVPVPVTQVDRARGEIGHGAPRLLPDGQHFLYARASGRAGASGLYIGRLDTAPSDQPVEMLLATESRPVYAPSQDARRGHILLVTNNVLMAYPFDAAALRLSGEPLILAEGVGAVNSGGGVLISSVSASRTGVLAYAAVPRHAQTGIDVVFNWMQLLKPDLASPPPPGASASRGSRPTRPRARS
jgi:hypothetical protein